MAPILPSSFVHGPAGTIPVGQRQPGTLPRMPPAPPGVTSAGSYQPRHQGHQAGNGAAGRRGNSFQGSFPPGRGRYQHYQQRNRFATCASKSAVATGAAQTELRAGALALFTKNDKLLLGLVTEPDGKKNWWMLDQNGNRSSVQPKAAQLVLPGTSYTAADLERFATAARSADMSLMEIAWSIAVDDLSTALTLQDLSKLLFDDDAPLSLYTTYMMLQADSLYFQQASKLPPSYKAKSEAVVEQLKQQQEAEQLRRLEQQAFVDDANAALNSKRKGSAEDWLTGRHSKRIAALQEFAIKQAQCSAAADKLAREALQLLQLAPTHNIAYELLVDLGLYRRHDPITLLRAGISLEYPADLESAAAQMLAQPPADPDASRRHDLSHMATFTIDDASTTEVDDGLSVETLPDGSLRLWIHIADPTRWVLPGDALDLEGRRRTRTLYLPWGMVPMFPRSLAEGPFSLNAGGLREAMSISAVLGSDGAVREYKVMPSLVLVSHKLTYEQVDEMLAQPAHCPHEELLLLQRAAELRNAWRRSCDSVDICLPEAKVDVPAGDLDSSSPAVTIKCMPDGPARRLVQEMMVLAGEVVGTLGDEQNIPLPYRGQEAPTLPDSTLLAALPTEEARAFALKRCMTRSNSSSSAIPHASLGLPAYVQFTSPIRRYSDVIAHHQIKAWLRGAALPYSRRDIDAIMGTVSEYGRDLGRLEGDVTRYWVAEYFRQHQAGSWKAQVLGYVKQDILLAAVLLETLGLETVVRLDMAVQPGQYVELQVSAVNPAEGFYRLVCVGVYGDEGEEEEAAAKQQQEKEEEVQ